MEAAEGWRKDGEGVRRADDAQEGGAERLRRGDGCDGRDLLALVLVEPVLSEEGWNIIEVIPVGTMPRFMSRGL